jgi:ABC-type Fe3+-citrate transport system substrate-binding protein
MDIYNIKTYFKCDNQKKAIMQAIKYGISKQKFFEMKKKAGFTNWTKEKRKYKKEQKEANELAVNNEQLEQLEQDNIIMVQNDNKDIEIPCNIWTNIEKIE